MSWSDIYICQHVPLLCQQCERQIWEYIYIYIWRVKATWNCNATRCISQQFLLSLWGATVELSFEVSLNINHYQTIHRSWYPPGVMSSSDSSSASPQPSKRARHVRSLLMHGWLNGPASTSVLSWTNLTIGSIYTRKIYIFRFQDLYNLEFYRNKDEYMPRWCHVD